MKTVGLFGGTFDPVHNGHIQLARQAVSHFLLDEVQFLPCANPVHRKAPVVSSEHRLNMLRAATEHDPKLTTNTLEIDRGGPSYMIDTLHQMFAQNKPVSIYLLIGVDAFNAIKSWKSVDEILQQVSLVVCRRPGVRLDRSVFPDQYIELDIDENPCASSVVRRQLKMDQPVESCLAAPVISYIKYNHLYENQCE
ncbi:MAG: nicotinate (nicotinamide) nucleotide adenylyltransferase [Gammaproteobacteria bacterium]|nr:nicotinate (nicotinamide) nucleotide adenylyltransferase [Gammaproteobacteria bacterium]